MKRFYGIWLLAFALHAEVYTLTLRQVVDRALNDSPDIALARLDEQKAVQAVRITKDPFSPRIGIGSGLAYNNGFPFSSEGAGPSVVQARASQFVYNRQQSYLVAQARENARGAGFATSSKREEVAYRTASLYLDADRSARLGAMASKQVDSLAKVLETVRGRVQEGRELPIESDRANLEVMKARQRAESLLADRDFAERSLAMVLGYTAEDRVRALGEDRATPKTPATEQAAVETALASNKELKRLESAMIAKGLEIRSDKAAKNPRVDLVAQYGFFAKFNHYDEYYQKFQHNNGQIGFSFQLPVMPGPAVNALTRQAEGDSAHLRIEMNALRNRISLDIHKNYQDIERAEMARSVAKADLDLARGSLSITLAQMQEGRASLRQVEEARFLEDEKWIAFFDAQFTAEKARYNLLRQTGDLVAEVR
ncbi:MAG: TolC family protein [Bryobacteraceae bacterium]